MNTFKSQFVVPCWIFILAFLVSTFYFRSLTGFFGVFGYFAVLYALMACLFLVIFLYVKKEILVDGISGAVIDLSKVYKELRIEMFFPKLLISKDILIVAGPIILAFILLPYMIYEQIQGLTRVGSMPLPVLSGISVYCQVRIIFELGFLNYSK